VNLFSVSCYADSLDDWFFLLDVLAFFIVCVGFFGLQFFSPADFRLCFGFFVVLML
jgi:hypothetical protein